MSALVGLKRSTLRSGALVGRVGRSLNPLGTRTGDARTKKPRLLLLTASTGGGHLSATQALSQELYNRSIDCLTVDVVKMAPQFFQFASRDCYEMLVKHRPRLYGKYYYGMEEHRMAANIHTMVEDAFQARLGPIIERYRPDGIIAAHCIPLPRLARLAQTDQRMKLAVVLTDIYPHSFWLRANPDIVFAPSDWSRKMIEERAWFMRGRITVTGIPINPVFSENEEKRAARERLGLDPNMPTMLVTSGAIGAGPFRQVMQSLADLKTPIQVVFICGKNLRALKRISANAEYFVGLTRNTYRVIAHVTQRDMASLMRASDFLVGKPGGLTTFESLSCGCPFLIYQPFLIPGQEEFNAEFLVENGAGKRVASAAHLRQVVEHLLTDPHELATMRLRAQGLARPHAAKLIVDTLADFWLYDRISPANLPLIGQYQ